MTDYFKKWFKWEKTRDNNYYFGLILIKLGILSIVFYLIFDAYEPMSFLITFLLCGWGFVLLWKSDNDLRFKMVQKQIIALEDEIYYAQLYEVPLRYGRRYRKSPSKKS